MYLLYLDESGTHSASNHLIAEGAAVFERSAYWLQQDLDAVVQRYFADDPENVAIHASPLRVPEGERARPPYNRLTARERHQMLLDSYDAIGTSSHPVLIATVVEKEHVAPRDPYEVAFEDVISRFDLMLSRRHNSGDTQRGLA